MSVVHTKFSDALYEYAVNLSLSEDPLLTQLREETLKLPGANMLSSPEQVQFITTLIRLMKAKRVIEMGTFTGYTALAMAKALPDDGCVLTCDIHSEMPQMGQKYWESAGVAEKIELFIVPGLTFLDELILQREQHQYDLTYIDADKKNYKHYYEKLITLIRPGGLLLIDNVFWNGAVIDASVTDATTDSIRHFNEFLKQDERIILNYIPLGDGLAMAFKK